MKKHFIKSIIFLTFLLISTSILYAVPANPDPVIITQPDGTTLTVFVRGDERINWYESMDGYTLLHNKAGYLSYAQLDETGNLQSSDYIATDVEKRNIVISSFLNTIEKNLFYSEIQVQLKLKIWEIEDAALNSPKGTSDILGEYKTICAFVQFPEKAMVKSMEEFDGLFNEEGYSLNGAVGSVRDYFKEVSYGQFGLTITLCGIYTAPKDEYSYAGQGGSENVRELARWIAQQVILEPGMDLRNYDTNNDKEVDGFHFIFAGRGKETGEQNAIWSHKSQLSSPVSQNGIKIDTYSCSPELYGNTLTGIGVICHEMTHAICGAADFYDTDYEIGGKYPGTGKWDLMAEGNYNGNSNRPAHPNMFIKIQCGWVTPLVLTSRTTITNMPNSAENPVAYRINSTTPNEYFLLENRQKVKFDSLVPGDGLLIYHVHAQVLYAGNCINCKHPQRMYPVSVSQKTPMPNSTPSSYGYVNSTYCPFPSTGNYYQTVFSDDTSPAMWSWADKPTKKPISDIKNENKLVSFDFMDPAVVGIDDYEMNSSSSLIVIPNPANEYIDLKVTSDELQETSIKFYNVFGMLVKSVPYNNASTQRIFITDLSKGIYFIQVGNKTAKLLVQ